jgi:hypothetical protein
MSELSRMAQPLLDRPVVTAPTVAELRHRVRVRRRRHALGGATAVVLIAAAVLVATLPGAPSRPAGGTGNPSTLTAYIRKGVSVSNTTLEAIALPASVLPPESVPGGMPLTEHGRPVVVFVGAGFCPYCAMERWALVVALSRFGTFSHLGRTISSSSTDVFPGLQSWSFKGSSFSSPSLAFDPAEVYSSTPDGTGYEPLQRLSALQQRVFDRYGHQVMPFIDIGGRYVVVGASANPAVLQHLTLDQIAGQLDDPSSPVARSVDGTANYLIAAMCSVAARTTAPICRSPLVADARSAMAAHPFGASAPFTGY